MAKQEQRNDAELQLEVALALLPLIGRSVTVIVDGVDHLRQQGPRIEEPADRRALVQEVARCWSALRPSERKRYSWDWATGVAKFTVDYVEQVELSDPDGADWQAEGYDVAIEAVWRRHVEQIRRRDEAG
ncbi:hypothetical protein [Dactylosporangium sp. NPDC051541]|uniref:hypothetical protein n=1 Tax=Dactylosporangium sp. NPDC051541 TaxID=3363977 RepID=UPI00379FD7FA